MLQVKVRNGILYGDTVFSEDFVLTGTLWAQLLDQKKKPLPVQPSAVIRYDLKTGKVYLSLWNDRYTEGAFRTWGFEYPIRAINRMTSSELNPELQITKPDVGKICLGTDLRLESPSLTLSFFPSDTSGDFPLMVAMDQFSDDTGIRKVRAIQPIPIIWGGFSHDRSIPETAPFGAVFGFFVPDPAISHFHRWHHGAFPFL